jgi:hypothetical protein
MDTLINLLVVGLSELQAIPERKYAGARRLAAAAVFAALAVVVAAGALGCGVAAFWIYLSMSLGPVSAAVGSMLLLIFVGIALAVAARSLFREEQRDNSGKNVVRDELLRAIQRGFEHNKGAALLAALIAGIATGTTTRSK